MHGTRLIHDKIRLKCGIRGRLRVAVSFLSPKGTLAAAERVRRLVVLNLNGRVTVVVRFLLFGLGTSLVSTFC